MRWLFTKTKIVAHGTRPFYMWIGLGVVHSLEILDSRKRDEDTTSRIAANP